MNVTACYSNSVIQLLYVTCTFWNTVLEFVTVSFALGHFKLEYEFTKVNNTTIKKKNQNMNSKVALYLSLRHCVELNCSNSVSSLGKWRKL